MQSPTRPGDLTDDVDHQRTDWACRIDQILDIRRAYRYFQVA
ncbi:hypothetical protein [Nocardia arizonensis]|nr:hypothetical protein [Nocardia arizonensis]